VDPAPPRELLAADGFAAHLGIRLVSTEPDEVVVALEVTDDLTDHTGRLPAGVVFGLADCAMSLISNTQVRSVAVATHLVRRGVAAGKRLVARAVPAVEAGDTTTWRIEVRAGEQVVGTFTGTTLAVG
jgi:uncharacterized protein (TIGR00369 family)